MNSKFLLIAAVIAVLAAFTFASATTTYDEEQGFFKKIGRALGKVVQTVPISVVLEEGEMSALQTMMQHFDELPQDIVDVFDEAEMQAIHNLRRQINRIAARGGVVPATLDEEEAEQKWKGWKKIGNVLKKVVTQIPISIALDEDAEEEQKWKGWRKLEKIAKKIITTIPIAVVLDEEFEGAEQRWKGWDRIGRALTKIPIAVTLDEESEGAEQRWKGWDRIGRALTKIPISIALDEESDSAEQGWKGWKKIGNAIKKVVTQVPISIALDEDVDAEQKWKGWKKIEKALKKVIDSGNISVTLEEDEAEALRALEQILHNKPYVTSVLDEAEQKLVKPINKVRCRAAIPECGFCGGPFQDHALCQGKSPSF